MNQPYDWRPIRVNFQKLIFFVAKRFECFDQIWIGDNDIQRPNLAFHTDVMTIVCLFVFSSRFSFHRNSIICIE